MQADCHIFAAFYHKFSHNIKVNYLILYTLIILDSVMNIIHIHLPIVIISYFRNMYNIYKVKEKIYKVISI